MTAYEHWRKSGYSNPESECVEVARSPQGLIGVRDTKQDGTGPVLTFTPHEWATFLDTIRGTALDQPT